MTRKVLINVFYLLFLILNTSAYAQKNKVGGSLNYNFRTQGFGISARAEFPIESVDWYHWVDYVSVVPRAVYYLGNYQEFYLGSDVHLGFYHYHRWNYYALANLGFNGWINHADTLGRNNPQFANWAFEMGGGINTRLGKCWHPFAELRVNTKWWDPSVQLGIVYTLKCDRRGAVPCSKIPKQPFEFFKEE